MLITTTTKAKTTMTTKAKNEAKRDTNKRASAPYITLTALCAKHERDPKIIRAKARRIAAQLKRYEFAALSDERWAFTNNAATISAVEALLFKRAS